MNSLSKTSYPGMFVLLSFGGGGVINPGKRGND